MMKRFKLGLAGLLLGLFGFTCFSGASSNYVITGHYSSSDSNNIGRIFFVSNVPMIVKSSPSISFGCSFSNVVGNNSNVTLDLSVAYLSSISAKEYSTSRLTTVGLGSSFNESLSGFWKVMQVLLAFNSDVTDLSFDYQCSFTSFGDTIVQDTIPYCPSVSIGGNSCPEVNTGEILSGYCDTNYCVENDLCPVPSNFSTLFINDIEHQSAPIINVTIPYEYSWDSSVDSGQFDLVISGQNVDYEYIDGIIRTQQTTPNNTDFNNIVSGLIPLLIPGLVIILFLRFIFKFIKKIF